MLRLRPPDCSGYLRGSVEVGGGRGAGEPVQALGAVRVLAPPRQGLVCEPGGVRLIECGRVQVANGRGAVRREGGEVRIGAGQGLQEFPVLGGVRGRVGHGLVAPLFAR